MKQDMSTKIGFFQALGVSLYIFLVGLFFSNADNLFPKMGVPFGPILLLLLFSTSALICGLIVFYKPYKLFFAGKKKEAINTVISTAAFLFLILVLYLGALLLFR